MIPLLVRYSPTDGSWTGDPATVGQPAGQVAEVQPVGGAEPNLGELRVFFGSPVRLGERERSGLAALGASVDVALRNAAAHARLAAMADAAAHAARHDPLTRLPVRQVLLDWIDAHLQRCRSDHGDRDDPVGLICLNIKGFAEIHSEFSTDIADRLLVHAARQLAAGISAPEGLAHLGGDTFAVWLPNTESVQHLRGRLDHLLAVISTPATARTGPAVLSGVAGFVFARPSAVGDAEHLLRQAQVALRSAHRRRQQTAIYQPEDDIRGHSAVVLRSELSTAIPDGQLTLVYQPVLRLADGHPVAVEAQPRWRHPSRGLLPPAVWMPVLEQSDLVAHYIRWALEEALTARRLWYQHGIPTPVAVQLPSPALLDPALPATVAAALTRAGLTPAQLTIELAGSWVLDVADDLVINKVLTGLVNHGVGLAVDIAGLSLEHLCRIPATEITLSAATTTRLMSDDQEARAKVRAIVACADELDLPVRAQNIATLDHIKTLTRLRVQTGQGPCLGRPRSASQIAGALKVASELTLSARDATVITFHPRTPRQPPTPPITPGWADRRSVDPRSHPADW